MKVHTVEASETEQNYNMPGRRLPKDALHLHLTRMNETPGTYFYEAYTTEERLKDTQLALVRHIAERVRADAAMIRAMEAHIDQIPSPSHV